MRSFDDLIGIPFAYGGRGPDTYDCYGLLRELFRRDGKNIPDYKSPSDGARISAMIALDLHLWKPAARVAGSGVLIRVPGNTHVGYLIDPMHMIHTWDRSGGVTIERLSVWEQRIKGFYDYAG